MESRCHTKTPIDEGGRVTDPTRRLLRSLPRGRQRRQRTSKDVARLCDLSDPPEFGDPPVDVANRHRAGRSRDPWIDGQLLDAAN